VSSKKGKSHLNKNVVLTGLTSFFTDISSEMLYPILQVFVSVITVNVGPILGLMEGIGESLSSVLKVLSGYYSDKLGKRKWLAVFGYFGSALSKLFLFVPSVFSVLSFRFIDRTGKGIRTAPRDAIISESIPKTLLGKAFGFQRGMDFAGAFFGTALLYILVKYVYPEIGDVIYKGVSAPVSVFYPIFIIAVCSALVGASFLFFVSDKGVKAKDLGKETNKALPDLDIRKYDKNLRVFFLAQFVFTLGNSSNQFLLLRSTNLYENISSVLLMYMLFNVTTSLLSSFFGGLSDKIGRKKLLVCGYLLYSVVYIAFGFMSNQYSWLLWLFWPLYGVYYAMTEGVEKAFVSELAPQNSRGTALGFYNMIVGVGLLPASLIAGFIYPFSNQAPFIFGGIMSILAVVIITFRINEKTS
jgi:MFS family permease